VKGVADAAAQRAEVRNLVADREVADERKISAVGRVHVRGLNVGLDVEHQAAGLIVVTDLAAANHAGHQA